MAARTRKIKHDQKTKDKIQASQLVNALTDHVLGRNDMRPSQVTAALGLLKKTIPDLSATQLSGDVAHSMVIQVVKFGDDTPAA